jgi:hypothetical protein
MSGMNGDEGQRGRGAGAGRPGDDRVGSVAEEAAKLFGAFSEWAREHDPEEHLATGAPQGKVECDWCPVCRAAHLVRECGPEVRTHLTSAAASLLQAAAARVAAAGREAGGAPGGAPGGDPGRRDRSDGFEHIDLDPDRPGSTDSTDEEAP